MTAPPAPLDDKPNNQLVNDAELFSSPYRPDGKLYGFVCIVTGATSSLGRAVVHELAAHGAACIYACSRGEGADDERAAFAALVDDVAAHHPRTKVIPYPVFDAAAQEAVLALIDEVLNAWGRLDVLVSYSPVRGPSALADTSPAQLAALFEAHGLAPFLALKHAPPAMAKTMTVRGSYPNATPKTGPYGSIVVVSSVASSHGGFGGPGLTMSSHAALGVVKAGVAVLKGSGSGVRINAVSAGLVDEESGRAAQAGTTGRRPVDGVGLERAGVPQEVARVVGFLASGFSSYMTGTNVVVDGGVTAMNPLTISA